MEQLCRNGKHPIDYRLTQGNGRTRCKGCRDECRGTRVQVGLDRMGGWQQPVRDEARAQALAVWMAGVDAAIEEARRTEGFDGSSQTWQTLGSILPPDPTPRPVAHPVRPPSVDRRVVRFPLTPDGMPYIGNSTRSARLARFQAMAAAEIGRLAQ